ncbi:zinc finger protein [Cystoisospora suis]|uniref:Zinc finger protein n=1 Tax=Cystoisospora suis TaxID=483139 RepID=A0A2C6KT95_9APIC|nr:zinc finger protein [Cystoisospora suis]
MATKACLRLAQGSCSFGLNRCQYCHSTVWTRRPPFLPFSVHTHTQGTKEACRQRWSPLLRYLPVACSNLVIVDGRVAAVSCPRGQSCPFSHSHDEIVYHPLLYKTEECEDYERSCCDVYYCWKAHSQKERRKPPKMRLGLIKGVDVQVFYPGVAVVSVNSPPPRPFSKGKCGDATKGQEKCVSGRGARGSRGNRRGAPPVLELYALTYRNLKSATSGGVVEGVSGDPQSIMPSSLGSLEYGRPPLPPVPGVTRASRMNISPSVGSGVLGTAVMTGRVPTDSAHLSMLQNCGQLREVVAGNPVIMDNCGKTMAELLRRSVAVVEGDGPVGCPDADRIEAGCLSKDTSTSVGTAAALLAMMLMDATRIRQKVRGDLVDQIRRDDYIEEVPSQGVYGTPFHRDLRVTTFDRRESTRSSDSYASDQDTSSLGDIGSTAGGSAYPATRADSDGELVLVADNSSRQARKRIHLGRSSERILLGRPPAAGTKGPEFPWRPVVHPAGEGVKAPVGAKVPDTSTVGPDWVFSRFKEGCGRTAGKAEQAIYTNGGPDECLPLPMAGPARESVPPVSTAAPALGSRAPFDRESGGGERSTSGDADIVAVSPVSAHEAGERFELLDACSKDNDNALDCPGDSSTQKEDDDDDDSHTFMSGKRRQSAGSTQDESSSGNEDMMLNDDLPTRGSTRDLEKLSSVSAATEAVAGGACRAWVAEGTEDDYLVPSKPEAQLRQAVDALKLVRDGKAGELKKDILLCVAKERPTDPRESGGPPSAARYRPKFLVLLVRVLGAENPEQERAYVQSLAACRHGRLGEHPV